MHRHKMYFKRRQADFDSRVVKQGSKIHAEKTFGVDLTKVASSVQTFFAPKSPVLAYC